MSRTALRIIFGLKGLRLCSCKCPASIYYKKQGAKRQAALEEFLVLIKKDCVSAALELFPTIKNEFFDTIKKGSFSAR